MTNYLDRYQAGERIEVWAELAAPGDEILIPPHYTQALAVVQTAMREAAAANDENAEALGLAAHALAEVERSVALPVLRQMLYSDDSNILPFILATFIEGLVCNERSYSEDDLASVYDRLLNLLKHSDLPVRRSATCLLGYLRKRQAATELAAMLHDEDAIVRRWAVYGLEHLRSTDALIAALNHADSEVRRAAIYALGEVGGSEAVIPIIRQLYTEPDDKELAAIAQSLSWLGGRRVVAANMEIGEANELLPHLSVILERETATAKTREQVATIIGMLGGPQTVAMFVGQLASNNVSVRRSAISGLIETESDEAVSALQHLADSDSGESGLEARRALAQITHRRLYPPGSW